MRKFVSESHIAYIIVDPIVSSCRYCSCRLNVSAKRIEFDLKEE